jgi:hypothetical protein
MAAFRFPIVPPVERAAVSSEFPADVSLNQSHQRYLPGELRAVWFPRQIDVLGPLLGHTEFAFHHRMISPFGGLSIVREPRDLKKMETAAQAGKGKGFVEFHIGITPEEKAEDERFIAENEGKLAAQVCVSGTCGLVDRPGLNIPFPFRWSPGLNAFYFSVQHFAGNPRVQKIEAFGDASLKDLLFAVSLEVTGFAAAFGAIAGGLTYLAASAL